MGVLVRLSSSSHPSGFIFIDAKGFGQIGGNYISFKVTTSDRPSLSYKEHLKVSV